MTAGTSATGVVHRLAILAAAPLGIFALVAAAVTATSATPGAPLRATPGFVRGSAGCGRAPDPGPTAPSTAETGGRGSTDKNGGDGSTAETAGGGSTGKTGGTGDVAQTLVVGGVTRSYRLAVPSRYHPENPAPLILLFHGSGSNALQTSVYTEMPKRAAQSGYFVATPDAVGGQWQLGAASTDNADLAFTSAIIGSLSTRYCIDLARLYAAGFSLGSEFAAVVACTVPHRIAAIGLASAEFLPHPCTGPLPVIAFHGTADPLVAYANGGVGKSLPGLHVRGAEQNMSDWARLDRCHPKPVTKRVASAVVRRQWRGCAGASTVVLYTVVGGGHTWPGSPIALSPSVFGPTTHEVDATGLMLRFFTRHQAGR